MPDQRSFNEGDWVRLKNEKLPDVPFRDWYVDRIEGKEIVLRCFFKGHALRVYEKDVEVVCKIDKPGH
jgi:hypothetical protein